MKQIKLSDFPVRVLKRDLEVDGIKDGMSNFIYSNCIDQNTNHISKEQLQAVIDLKKGNSIYIGLVLVTRLS